MAWNMDYIKTGLLILFREMYFSFYYYPLTHSQMCLVVPLSFSVNIVYNFFLSPRLLQVPPVCSGSIILTIFRDEPGYGSPYID
jgi:hypothetical protein